MRELCGTDTRDVNFVVFSAGELVEASDGYSHSAVSEHEHAIVFVREERAASVVRNHPAHGVFAIVDKDLPLRLRARRLVAAALFVFLAASAGASIVALGVVWVIANCRHDTLQINNGPFGPT